MTTYTGTSSADTLVGASTADDLYGLAANDSLIGGDGNDTLQGGTGADTLDGGAGFDLASYTNASLGVVANLATGVGTSGDANGDVLVGIEGLIGGVAGDLLTGDANANSLSGGGFNDVLEGGAGADTLDGGSGVADVASYANAATAVSIDLSTGVYTGEAAGDVFTGVEVWRGSAFADTFVSSASLNTRFDGGAGDDVYVVDSASDTVIEFSNEGADEVRANAASYTIGANVEKLTFVGSGNFSGTGNTTDNQITGGSGSDTLSGGAGADTLDGGGGFDLASYASATLGVLASLATGVGTSGDANGDVFAGIEGLIGGAGGDILTGDANSNSLSGGGFNDVLEGGTGADTLDGGSGVADVASYANAAAGVSINLSTGVHTGDAAGDVFTAIEAWRGSAFADTMTSSASLSTRFDGGVGDDVYVVDSTSDTVLEFAGEGADEVKAATASYTLASNVEKLTFMGSGNFSGTGNNSDNAITGGSGDDTLVGGAGADTLTGGAGFDMASYASSASVVIANLATGVGVADAAGDVFIGIEGLIGTNFNDQLTGDANANSLSGGVGNDVLEGGAGADTLDGGASTIDIASYANAAAAVSIDLTTGVHSGDAGGDVFTAVEIWRGSAFADTFASSAAINSSFQGGAGDDVFIVDSASDAVTESSNEGTDEVQATAASYTLAANIEKLTFIGSGSFAGTGNATDNSITGGSGNDTLVGGAGADTLNGGAGFDMASYAGSASVVIANLATGVGVADAAGDVYVGIEGLIGTGFNDQLTGDGAANSLSGGAGNDILEGGAGADTLDGGSGAADRASYANAASGVSVNLATGVYTGDAAGDVFTGIEFWQGSGFADTMTSSASLNTRFEGGAGDDLYLVDSTSDVVVESAAQGFDEVRTSIANYTLPANVESLVYTGAGNFTGTGDSAANGLTGGSGNDVLNGAGGDDTLVGGLGDDTLSGGDGNDLLVGGAGVDSFSGGSGVNVVSYATASAAVTINLTTGAHTGDAAGDSFTSIQVFEGTSYADTLTSSASVNTTFQGGAGDDVYVIDASADAVAEGVSGGSDEVRSTATAYVLATNVEKLTFTGSGNATLTGNFSDNVITGAGGDDVLDGAGGADTLIGGIGIDVASYASATAAVSINLSTGTHTGDAAGDSYTSIEVFKGTIYGDSFTSSTSADTTFQGGAGDDVYIVDDSSDVVIELGGEGDDEIRTTVNNHLLASNVEKLTFIGSGNFSASGNGSNNTITGGSGDDVLEGGGGGDVLIGGIGIDVASYASATAAVSINLSTGTHTGDAAGDSYTSIEVFRGSVWSDTFTSSTSHDSIIEGGDGNDVYFVDYSADVVIEQAGYGYDEIRTTASNYVASNHVEGLTFWGVGNATLTGNFSDNVITGAGGDDVLDGAGGADTLIGGIGIDVASYASATAAVSINLSTGTHTGDAAGDSFTSIEVFKGTIYGDSFTSSTSASTTFQGGAGDDVYIVDDSSDVVIEVGGEGDDEIRTTVNNHLLANNVEKLTFIGSGNFSASGNGSNNTITGGSGDDVLEGGGGGDVLIGGIGIDVASYASATAAVSINLSTGTHSGDAAGDSYTSIEVFKGTIYGDSFTSSTSIDTTFQGGGGDDIYIVDSPSDLVVENLNDGDDAIITTINNYGLSNNVEKLTFIGSGNSTLVGNGSNNLITGGAGGDSLSGGGGGDTLVGGGGSDSFDGGLDIDIVSYASATAAVYVDILGGVFSGYATGSTFVNVEGFIGSIYADTLMGGSGVDTIWGNDGDDFLQGNTGTDTLDGGSGADTLRGGQDDDLLYGGSGDDFVSGDRGDDTMTGGSGADIFHTWGAANVDRVLDFNASQGDRVQLDPGTSYTASQVGADTVIDMGGGNQMILVGVTLSSLPPGWIFM